MLAINNGARTRIACPLAQVFCPLYPSPPPPPPVWYMTVLPRSANKTKLERNGPVAKSREQQRRISSRARGERTICLNKV